MAIPFGLPKTETQFIEPNLTRCQWAKNEFGNASLGDPRRSKRLIKIAADRMAKPSVSLPQCFDSQATLKAAYHFYDNPSISREAILMSHSLATQERLNQENLVLAVSDTTEVDYSHHRSKTGLGYLHDKNHHGFLLHSTLVVTPSQVPLGLLDQQFIYRDIDNFGKKHNRKKRPIEEKESYKWLESLDAIAKVQKQHPNVCIVNVADRESDIFDYFVRAQQLDNQALLIRGAWNRCIEGEHNYLWDYIENQPTIGTLSVTVPRQTGKAARIANLSIRYGRVTLKPPKYRAKEHLPMVEIDVILAREENSQRAEAIEWLLMTTVFVNSLNEAIERVHWYACRWLIETYHKVLKSGCKIESRQIEAAESLERYLAVDSVVAWRVLGLTML